MASPILIIWPPFSTSFTPGIWDANSMRPRPSTAVGLSWATLYPLAFMHWPNADASEASRGSPSSSRFLVASRSRCPSSIALRALPRSRLSTSLTALRSHACPASSMAFAWVSVSGFSCLPPGSIFETCRESGWTKR